MPPARDVIEDIRRTVFGVGESNDIPAVRNLREILHRALQQLSEEIYSDEIHFVLELVQNAEDNEYAGVTPELRFVISQTHLLVLNNETGFGEASVRAICDVSRSTKMKARGHIGEKGIGFKSVFRVTNEPHIFSNGYQFRLPKHDPNTGLGYVIPFWVEDVPPQIVPGVTNILLPLTPEAQGELVKVADLNPSMLLFLKQLRRVEVVDEVRGHMTQISRDGSDDQVQLRSAHGVKSWKLVRRTVLLRPGLREQKRKGIIETELAIALPLSEGRYADGSHFHPVHAYLPIRDYGLRFAFHADFVLAAGREGILTDRPWNKWLRDSLPDLFLAAVDECKQDECLRDSFLAYVPRPEDDIDSFFAPAADAIREGLREAPCVLAASGEWVIPSESFLADDAIRAIICNDDAIRLLGKQFVAREFRADTDLLCFLGAAKFTMDDLIRCLKAADWLAERPDEWFSRLFAYLGTHELDSCLEELLELSIVPLEGGDLASTTGAVGGVFFPLSRHRKYGFEAGLFVVRGSILSLPEKGQLAAITKVLRQLGVKQASPVDLIREHMVPLFGEGDSANNWQSDKRGDEFRHGCVEYLKDHWEDVRKIPDLVSKLKGSLRVRVDGSDIYYALPGQMYLSKAYGNTNSLKQLFRDLEGIWFVDPVYLKRAIAHLKVRKVRAKRGKVTRGDRTKLRNEWRQFFVDLGVETNIRVVHEPETEKPNEADSLNLAMVIKTGDVDRISLALSLLDEHWDYFARWMKTKRLQASRGRTYDLGMVNTKFGLLLTDSSWIPVKGGALVEPGIVFFDQPSTRDLLGDSVAYLAVPIASDGLIDAIGLHRELTVEAAIDRLRQLARSGSLDRALFERLYTFLQTHYQEDSSVIDEAFLREGLIHIPTGVPRLLRTNQVFWKDCSAQFGDDRGYLESVYPHHRKFFRTQLEVPEVPAPEDYSVRLRELAEGGVADAKCEKVVWAIYREFDQLTREKKNRDEIMATDWWKEFAEQAIFLTEDGTFVERDGMFANDSDDYATSFRGRPGVALFKASSNRLPQVRHFLRAAGIRFLSRAVKQEGVVPQVDEPNEILTAHLRLLTPFLQRYLHHREPDLYDRLKAGGELRQLSMMQARTCEHPRARLTLGGVNVEVERPAVVAEDTLYVRAVTLDDSDSVAIALAFWLGNPKGLDDILDNLLEKREEAKVRRFLTRKGIPELPEEEMAAIGEAVRSVKIGANGAAAESKTPVEEPASLVRDAFDGQDRLQGSQASPPETSSAGPVGSSSPRASLPVERGDPSPQHANRPPTQPSSRGGTREKQRTDSDPTLQQSTAEPESRRPPLLPTERPAGLDWRQCEPEEVLVSWSMYEPPLPRGSRPVPSPSFDLLPPQWPEGWADSTDRTLEYSPEGESDDPPEVRSSVGKWGEQYAVRCLLGELLAKYPGSAPEETARGFCLRLGAVIVAELVWLNRDGEHGVGNDIEVIEVASRLFVEVKSTRDVVRACFDLSAAQWGMAQTHGSSYRITRVYNAGRADARVVHIPNPYQAWLDGALSVRSLRIVL